MLLEEKKRLNRYIVVIAAEEESIVTSPIIFQIQKVFCLLPLPEQTCNPAVRTFSITTVVIFQSVGGEVMWSNRMGALTVWAV